MPIREVYKTQDYRYTDPNSVKKIIDSLKSEILLEDLKRVERIPRDFPVYSCCGRVKDLETTTCFLSYIPYESLLIIIADNNGIDKEHQKLKRIRGLLKKFGIGS
jgi:hypothetical protein